MNTMVMTAGGRPVAQAQALRSGRMHAHGGAPNGRRAARQRPHGRPAESAATGARLSRAAHPLSRPVARTAVAPPRAVTRRQNTAVVAVTIAAIILIGLLGLFVRGLGEGGGPSAETTVQVEPGDTLFGIAERFSGGDSTAETVGRIRMMNELPGTTVHTGQTLRVPVTAG